MGHDDAGFEINKSEFSISECSKLIECFGISVYSILIVQFDF